MSHHFYCYFYHPARHFNSQMRVPSGFPRDEEVSLLSFMKEAAGDDLGSFESSCRSHYYLRSLRFLYRYVRAGHLWLLT
jgi:hypothetical protein